MSKLAQTLRSVDLCICYYARRYFGSALKKCPHLFCYQSSIQFFGLQPGLEPAPNPVPYRLKYCLDKLAGPTRRDRQPHTFIYTKGQLRVTNSAIPQVHDLVCPTYRGPTQTLGEPANPRPSCCEVRVLTTHRYVYIYDQNVSLVNWCGKTVF